MFKTHIIEAQTVSEIKNKVKETLVKHYVDELPTDKSAKLIIKPNLNSNMNALTGNTTDLRLIAAVVEFLKDLGYSHITIAEGTNSGFYRNKINIIERLKVDKLAAYYGIYIKDLNYSEEVFIDFENNQKAGVAKECIEAEAIINMPKLKTHFETGMSLCLKNLIGCLVGQANKKKTHSALAYNILNINKVIKPKIHVVDAIISMEGLGPTRGTPVKTGMVFIGKDPYILDLIGARLAGVDYHNVTTLAIAEKTGLISNEHLSFIDKMNLPVTFSFKPPKAGPIASFIHSPKRQRYFLAIRNTAFFNKVCSTESAGKILYLTGLRQDIFLHNEMNCERLSLKKQLCKQCGKCATYCPTGLNPVDVMPIDMPPAIHKGCLGCLYCYTVCPYEAIEFHGTAGFFGEQLRQYNNIIKEIA
ncbi:MAG: DUF362 domain-containing protein [Candidatus Magnetoovum sp. WYHC-5]|nr:DUF362 domain-containing protein [Candidatus Magnetoovum sp. WYHC-5]